jgi:protein-disulfide isomerase
MAKKRNQRKQPRQARRRTAGPPSSGIGKLVPYFLVGGFGVAIVVALFVVTAGGGSAAHPVGYEPPTLGAADAPVEFVLWEDFQCPFCKRFELETFPELEKFVDSGEVKFVWRNYQRYGSESTDAGIASNCAGEQGKFWEFKDVVFQNQRGAQAGVFTEDNLRQYAIDLGLDIAAYEDCFTNNSTFYIEAMRADINMGRAQGVTGTPGFFINDQFVSGAQPTSTFEAYISNALNEARQQ